MSNVPIVEFRNVRINKARLLREKGINPYPSRSSRTHFASDILNNYEEYDGQHVTVAGRLMSWREHGALSFGHIQDQTARIQLYLRQENVKPTGELNDNLGYADFNLLDVGDFVEALGIVTKTKRGEISILVESLRMLTKSLRPLPDKWLGLKDRESVLRRRYLDTTIHLENKKTFESISKMLFAIRSFLDSRGFLETLTPVLQPQYGGGTAKPFITHVNALDCDMYLAISHELYLKRMIAAGFDKVYTIGRYFRNEGIDRSHHPEFSMVETMTAYENYQYNMDLIEDMFRYIAVNVYGKTEFSVRGHIIDFGTPWRRISMADAVLEITGIDFRLCQTPADASAKLASLGIAESEPTVGLALAKAFEVKIEPTLIAPTFIFGHPVDISPLAKPMDDDPNYAERFEIFIAGMECGDNWSEQNDPVALLERWKTTYKPTDLESGEFHPLDYDFVEVLEYGIPPTTGIGPGIERMAMIFNGEENIDNVNFFPMMKPVLSPQNAAIYGIKELPNAERAAETIVTMDEFRVLLEDHILVPAESGLRVELHLKFWDRAVGDGLYRASGYLEVEGFLNAAKLRIAGYTVKSEEKLHSEQETSRYRDFVELEFRRIINTYIQNCDLEISDHVRTA